MKVVDLPKTEDKQLTEAQQEDLFGAIVRGKDVTETIKTSRGDFVVKYPRMKDLEQIGRLTAYRLNGLDARSFDNNTYQLIQQIAYLDVIVISGASWYENAKKENMGFSWGDIPIQSYIQEVYAKAYEFRLKVQEILERDPTKENSGMDSGKHSETVVSEGLFEGISSQS